eukprot:3906318-Alexandrium_andersonii.AAC.1
MAALCCQALRWHGGGLPLPRAIQLPRAPRLSGLPGGPPVVGHVRRLRPLCGLQLSQRPAPLRRSA